MAYEEVTGRVFSFIGDDPIKEIEGIYTGFRTIESLYNKKKTVTQIHSFNNNGEIIECYGKGQLDMKLKRAGIGAWCRVTYIDFDGTYHNFKVEVDRERSKAPDTVTESEETDEPMV